MARLLRILLVEDHSDDAYLFSVVAKTSDPAAGVHWVKDGQEAVEYLEGRGQYRDRAKFPLPDLIVVDLRMHGCDGFEFLNWLHTTRQQIPAVVWTGTLNPQEIERGLTLGARGIFTKPVRFEELVTIIGQICGHAEIRETARQIVDAGQTQK